MFRTLPPVGHPLRFKNIFRIVQKDNTENSFLGKWFPETPLYMVSSGSAALTLCLQSLRLISNRAEVILPAYTCPSLVSAVVRAGLQPVLCDVKPFHFQMDLDDLSARISSNTLAIMAVHLFGIPENISDLTELAKQKGVFIIEDAAQGFGNTCGEFGSDQMGRYGDLSVLSFGRGKPMSLLNGGAVIVNNSELSAPVTQVYQTLPKPKKWRFLPGYLCLLFLYTIFFHPRAHWLPRSLPWLRLGDTYFILDYDITKMGSGVFKFGNIVFKNFDEIRKTRLNLASLYRQRFEGFREVFAYIPDFEGANIALLRFPVIFKENEARDRILKCLEKKGLGATGSFPVPLNELEGACDYLNKNETYSNAKEVSERILTLPLHEYVTLEDIDNISKIIAERK